jgi:hypothetical protein
VRRLWFKYSLATWVLWLVAAGIIVGTTMMLADPALLIYLLDPELLALLVLVGAQYTRLQMGLLAEGVRQQRHRLSHQAAQVLGRVRIRRVERLDCELVDSDIRRRLDPGRDREQRQLAAVVMESQW